MLETWHSLWSYHKYGAVFVYSWQYASDVEAEVVGKPSAMFFQSVLDDMGIQPHEVWNNVLYSHSVFCMLWISILSEEICRCITSVVTFSPLHIFSCFLISSLYLFLSPVPHPIPFSEQALMIGDDLVNDVGGAQQCGMKGLQVRTGKYR